MSGNPSPLRVPPAGGLVEAVEPRSIADEIGLRPGDRITNIDGRELRDAVDFKYLISEESIELTVVRGDEEEVIALEKDPDEDLGVSFATATFDRITTCNNKCFFCFLKGLPKGLRKPLYLKDDDYRLSFAHGNFVTLTNLTDDDWDRLEEQRLSPLRVSVHATDLNLRRRLLGNPSAPHILEQLDRLADLGIRAHTQVVVCPGVNDGANLDQTINDLSARYPTVQSIAVVPVGASLTQEDRMSEIEGMDACDPAYARAMVQQVSAHQRRLKRGLGDELVYLSDEYYLTSGARLPSARRYNGYEQFENGIGMTRWLIEDFKKTRRLLLAKRAADREGVLPYAPTRVQRVAVLTGTLIAPTLSELFAELTDLSGVEADVVPVSNTLFGSRINASGLLPGRDLIEAGRGLEADAVLISRYALDWSGERFLDDVTADQLQRAIAKPVAFVTSMSEVIDLLKDPAWLSRPLTIGAGPNQAGRSWTYEVDATAELEAAPA